MPTPTSSAQIKALSFSFETTILRGRTEREEWLTVEYLFDGQGKPELWKTSIPVSSEEWNQLADQVADRADQDWADEYGEPARPAHYTLGAAA